MDVVNISRSRRFLRERPMRVNLFDRPRIVVDVVCLEGHQTETREAADRSDSLLVLIEGEGRLRMGSQIESLQEMDAVLVPPDIEYEVTNMGSGQLTLLVTLTPKPTRADEVSGQGDVRPLRRAGLQPPRRGASPDRPMPRREPGAFGDRPRPAPGRSFDRSGPRSQGDRPSYGGGRGTGDRDARGPRSQAGFRRNDGPGRDRPPARDSGGRGGYRQDRNEAPEGDERRPRRGSTGARPGRPGQGPDWYPKPKPAWRPRGAAPSGGPSGGRPGGRSTTGPHRDGEGEANRSPRGAGGPPNRRGGTGGFTGPSSQGGRRPPPSGPRRKAGPKTGDARRASRGQGPLSGRRGPGRSGPKT